MLQITIKPCLDLPLEIHFLLIRIYKSAEKVSDEDNCSLTQPFSEAEIKHALFQMERNKVAGPDKIPIEFYQSCWDIVKTDILELFDDFHKCGFDMRRLNYGVITLLPKIQDV